MYIFQEYPQCVRSSFGFYHLPQIRQNVPLDAGFALSFWGLHKKQHVNR